MPNDVIYIDYKTVTRRQVTLLLLLLILNINVRIKFNNRTEDGYFS